MFAVKINKSQFEYDVHSLVKAFYPEEMVKVLTPEMSSEKNKEWEENIGESKGCNRSRQCFWGIHLAPGRGRVYL